MNDREPQHELRDLDVLEEQAEEIKGGLDAGAAQLLDDEDIFYVVGKGPGNGGPRLPGGSP